MEPIDNGDKAGPPDQSPPDDVWLEAEPIDEAEASIRAEEVEAEIEAKAETEAGAAPKRIGRFEIQQPLGIGERSSVWLARDPLRDCQVIVKSWSEPADESGRKASERLLKRARIAIGLRHPHLAAVWEVVRDGRTHGVVSERVIAMTLRDRLDQGVVPTRIAVEWVRDLARAAFYTHSAGWDRLRIMPDQVLILSQGDEERVILRDPSFTRAKGADDGAAELEIPYASPEELQGRLQRIGPQSDVYRLGAVLYELLTGEPPYGEHREEILSRHRMNRKPVPPSAHKNNRRRERERGLERGRLRELDAICLKALGADPEARILTADALAFELDSWLKGPAKRRSRALRPIWLAVGFILIASCGILIAGLMMTILISRSDLQRERRTVEALKRQVEREQAQGSIAEQLRRNQEASSNQLEAARNGRYASELKLAQAAWELNDARQVAEILYNRDVRGEDRRGFEWRYWRSLLNRTEPEIWIGDPAGIAASAFSPNGDRLATGGRNGEVRIWDARTGKPIHVLKGHSLAALAVAFSPDGQRLASSSADGTIRIWSVETGQALKTIEGGQGAIRFAAFHRDGKRLATSGERAPYLRIWDVESGQEVFALNAKEGEAGSSSPIAAAVSRDSARLACADDGGSIRVWDWESREEIVRIEDRASAIALSADGEWLATTGEAGGIRIRSVADGQAKFVIATPDDRPAREVLFSPDGQRLAVSGPNGAIQFWDARSGARGLTLKRLEPTAMGPAVALAFSPDGRRLASGSRSLAVRLWDVSRSEDREFGVLANPQTPSIPPATATAMAYSPNGRRLAIATESKTLEIWDAVAEVPIRTIAGHDAPIRGLAISPDSKLIVAGDDRGAVRVWDLESGASVRTISDRGSGVNGAAISPNGEQIATAHDDGLIVVRKLNSGDPVLSLSGHRQETLAIAFHPNRDFLASGSADRTIKIWDLKSGANLETLPGHSGSVRALAFHPDGAMLASGGDGPVIGITDLRRNPTERHFIRMGLRGEGSTSHLGFDPSGTRVLAAMGPNVECFDLRTYESLLTLNSRQGTILAAALHPDGKRLVSAGADRSIRIWRAGSNIETVDLRFAEPKTNVLRAAYSPDGRILAAASERGMLRGWSAETHEELFQAQIHSYPIRALAFSPDSQRIALAGEDGTVRVWDIADRKPVWLAKRHPNPASSVVFSPDGKLVLSAGPDAIRLWSASDGQEAASWEGRDQVAISPDGRFAAAISNDLDIKIWDMATRKEVRTIVTEDIFDAIAFSPDGKRIAYGGGDSLTTICDVTTGETVFTFDESETSCLKFSPDGRWFVAADHYGLVRIWDAASGKELQWLEEHDDAVNDLTFLPDGKRMATVSPEGAVKVWMLNTLK